MPIKLNGATSGSVELDVPAVVGSDLQLTLPATAGEVVVKNSSGNVGVGTSSPTSFIHVQGTSTGTETYGRFTTGPLAGDQSLVVKSSSSRDHMAIQVATNGGTNDDLALQPDGGNVGIGTTSPSQTAVGRTVVSLNGTSSSLMNFNYNNTISGFIFAASDEFRLQAEGTIPLIFKGNSAERMRISGSGEISAQGIYDTTSSGAANVYVHPTNYILHRSTSSIKYKRNVEDLKDSYADAILGCRPVWYQSKCKNDNQNWGYWGFIAEEVAEIDPRLVSWKTGEISVDEKGKQTETLLETPLAEGVQYDRFVPHLLNLIKRQQQAIKTLETKVAALEGGAS